MKNIIFILISSLFFIGCNEVSIKEQKEQCLKDGKKFIAKKTLNLRTGEYQLKGRCT